MGRAYAPESIPDVGSFFPDGAYELEIEELNEEVTSTNKAMVKGVLRCAGPDLPGMVHFENFVLGNDQDPMADNEETLKQAIGARSLVRLLKKSGVELGGDLDADCAAAIGAHVIGVMTTFIEPAEKRGQPGVPNEYAGQVRNRVQFFALGERELGVQPGAAPAALPKPAARAAAPRAAAPAAAAPRAAAPAPRAAAPAPARPAAPAPRAAAAPAAAAAKKEPMLTCSVCQAEGAAVTAYPKSEFITHVNTHETE